jgi:aminopeptidase
MLTDAELNRYADVLVWALKTARKTPFKKQDTILVQYDPAAIRLAEILYDRILDMEINPVQRMVHTVAMELNFYKKANDRQLIFQPPGDKELFGHLNGRIFLRAPDSLTHLKDVDPQKIGKVLVAKKPLRDIMDKREEGGHYSWTLCTLPTEELATQARMTPEAYKEQLIRACYLDLDDPVSKWRDILKEVTGIKNWLNRLSVKSFHVESSNVDLTITPGEKRKWVGVSGHNIPSFELFLSPDWRGTEGFYYANLPSFRSGNYVEGIRITFRKGKVVSLTSETGEDFAVKQLAMDRGACRVGEFSLTDRRFSRIDRFMADTLFDENHGGKYGNCHIAMGSSYSTTYNGDPATLTKEMKKKMGFNDSALHWDIVNTEDKTVTAHLTSGREVVIYEGGIFKHPS